MLTTTTRQNDARLHELLYPDTFTRIGASGDVEYRDVTKGVFFRVPFYHRDRDAIHGALKTAAIGRPSLLHAVATEVLSTPPLAKLSDLLIADADVIAPVLLNLLVEAATPGMDVGV